MIGDSIRVGASALIGQLPGQNTQTTQTNSSSPAPGGRIIRDPVNLSSEARQTLESHRQAEKDKQDKLVDEIMTKGIKEWAQEKYKEKIEAEVRAQVLSSMGLKEDDFASLEAKVQQRIEEIIKEKVKERLKEEMEKQARKSAAASGQDTTFQTAFLDL